jgi:hypothetical protein
MSGASGLRPHDHGSAGGGGSLASTAGFASPMTTQDDIIIGGASGVATRLAKGTDSQVLTVDPSTHHLVWATPSSGFSDPMTTRGDIIVRNASNATDRLGRGAASTVLTSDGTDIAWTAPAAGTGTAPLQSATQAVFSSDCFFRATSTIYDGDVAQSVSGSGAATSAGPNPTDVNHPGVIQLSCGTTTTGRCGLLGLGGSVVFGGGAVTFGSVVNIYALSDGTNTFTVRTGLGDRADTEPNDGAYFRYTHSVNGGRWQAVTRSNDSETVADTGISATANTDGFSAMHRFEVLVNAAGTSVDFKIDGTLVATNVATIPTGAARATSLLPLALIASAGTGFRIAYLDAYWCTITFTTAR